MKIPSLGENDISQKNDILLLIMDNSRNWMLKHPDFYFSPG